MPTLGDTVYPRLHANPDEAELSDAFTPTPEELTFATKRTRQSGPRLTLLVMLKTFQCLGRFIQPDEVPPAITMHIAVVADLVPAIAAFDRYDTKSSYRSRLMALVRDYVGVGAYGPPARKAATTAAIDAARSRDDLADIVNAAIEELARCRFELPSFGTLLKIARAARALVNRSYHRQIAAAMTPDIRERLLALLTVSDSQSRSAWDTVKSEPRRPSPARMRAFLQHLCWLRDQTVNHTLIVNRR